MNATKLRDHYPDWKEFEEILNDAESNASTEWQIEFVSDIKEKFTRYRERMFLSQKQIEALSNIAYGKHEERGF